MIVRTRTFAYPADAASLAKIRAAGGLSKLSADEQKAIRWKEVSPGEYCDDMPAESVALRLERGEIARVTVADDEDGA